uniref:Uncharacterized protein n=1 Tax=Setaria italica TaxID=4555 RepID=K4A3W3_SETIT
MQPPTVSPPHPRRLSSPSARSLPAAAPLSHRPPRSSRI